MNKKSRTQYAVKNVSIAGIGQVLYLLLSFASRTVFVKMLGNDYLSCEGLFTNILTILSFSDLGIGGAIVYSLYKPIAENDYLQIGKLMNLLSTAYRYIACFIAVVGICVVPFLKYIISDVPDVRESIPVLYCLFLTNIVMSYLWGYSRSLLVATQENYIVLMIQQGVHICQIVIQITLLILTHNYILYLLTAIGCTFTTNIISTWIAYHKYPWLKQYQQYKLSAIERKPIFSNIMSIMYYKLGSVILNGTNNIIISICLKTSLVGLCSNYSMIINAITTIIRQVGGGLQATIGNHNALSSAESRYQIFKQLYFISFWLLGFCSISLTVLLNPFIEDVWLGKAYSLPNHVVLMLVLSFYINLINIIPSTYRITLGYFKEAKWCPLLAAILNVILSILGAQMIGLSGVFLAEAISRLLTFNIIDAYNVFKKGFQCSIFVYYKQFFIYFLILCVNYFLTYFCTQLITLDNIMGFCLKALITCIVSNAFFILVFARTSLFQEATHRILKFVYKKSRGTL